MRYVSAAGLICLCATRLFAAEPLPSRELPIPCVAMTHIEPMSFDLLDFRSDERQSTAFRSEVEAHSIFGIKSHVGFAGGYDNGSPHGSLGFYITVAEWGRWNFGVPSPELGFGYYSTYDSRRKIWLRKKESSIFISLASVHYRLGYLRSMGVNAYLNFEQIFDSRQNMTGSQVGVSFSPVR